MLTKSEEKFLKAYEKPLQWPKWKFVVTQGLSWAVVTMVLVTLLDFSFEKGAGNFTFRSVLIRLIVWLVGGLVFGMWMRAVLWKRYQKIKTKAATV